MATSPISGSGAPNWLPASPTIASKISRASRASAATIHGNENDVEELEMLLEVICPILCWEVGRFKAL
jgi:magnesium transporter